MFLRRLALAAVVVLAAAGLLAAPAAADPPEITKRHIEDLTLTFPAVCDFPLRVVFDVDLTIMRFFDKEGNLIKRVVHVRETDAVFTNVATGKSVEERVLGVFRQMTPNEVRLSDEMTVAGLFFHLTLPGQGSVVLDAGRFIRDLRTGELIFEAGPKPFAGGASWAVLCPVLS